MIYCPSCGSEVSTLAMACRWCGFPIVLYTSMKRKYENSDYEPLELVAMNPHTPQVILDMLSEDDNTFVRAGLARNPKAPEALLLRLADDEYDYVRTELASSPFITVNVMEKLSNDESLQVIEALHQNPATPEYIQSVLEERLTSDPYKTVVAEDCEGVGGENDGHIAPEELLDHVYRSSYFRYGDQYLPYRDGSIEYDGKEYVVGDFSDYGGETMYFDEDNGWLTELP